MWYCFVQVYAVPEYVNGIYISIYVMTDMQIEIIIIIT